MQTVVIDSRNICKIASYSILSGSVACCFPTETEEIAHRLAKRLYCLRLDYPSARFVFAFDRPPYWRTRYLTRWYSDRGLEPVVYKGNREGMSWPFASTREALDQVYEAVLTAMAGVMDASIIQDAGLEADDIWGLLASKASANDRYVGVSSDSDWRQLCGPHVEVYDPMSGETCREPLDITPKLIAGDRGDNIMGCPKPSKAGVDTGKRWAIDGAKKLIAKNPETWADGLDKDVLERNWNVIKLPCPLWEGENVELPVTELLEASWEQCEKILDGFGLTAGVRKLMEQKAEREAWIAKLRAHLQKESEDAMENRKEISAPSPSPAPVTDNAADNGSPAGDIGPLASAPVAEAGLKAGYRPMGYVFTKGKETNSVAAVDHCRKQGHVVVYEPRNDMTVCTCHACKMTWVTDRDKAEDEDARSRNAWAKSGGSWD